MKNYKDYPITVLQNKITFLSEWIKHADYIKEHNPVKYTDHQTYYEKHAEENSVMIKELESAIQTLKMVNCIPA
jgi:hypothetical protein